MELLARWRSRVAGHPGAADSAMAWAVIAVTLATTVAAPQSGGLTWAAVLTAMVAGGALAHRRRYPFTVLLITAAAAEAYLVQYHGHQGTMVVVAPLIALYTVADASPRRRGLAVAVAVLFVFGAVHVVMKPKSWLGTDNLALAALGGLAIAAGIAARNRRLYLAEAQARAAQAEADREAETTRRLTEERLRIARDLHDAVGHQLALISVQARVAAHVLASQPQQTREALDHVHVASRTALEELTDTVGLLRQPGDSAPTEPAPGLAGLDALLAGFRRSGLAISARVDGAPRPLPAAADHAAYRVLQEALTNVCKHAGPTAVRVRLDYREEALHLVVENDSGVVRPAGGAGHGVVGMRERVSALGGSLAAGLRPDGGYAVQALLPLAGGTG